ncbi:class I lanthipeptide [uncultured Lacinutrix sp.]|uniref:class I lanthipeptide n=1 Tax=uncultured Lacinutrix sp. TaxID=574032 RepID=UPI002614DAA0|nr:class I lanthipeptide [uncultured Lacinutrix sp.]
MKKKLIKNLSLSKTVIAKIQLSTVEKIKGGTDPISPPIPPEFGVSAHASQCGMEICY